MNTDNDMINNLLGNMRLRGNQSPQCNVQIHPASSDYPDLNETYRCRIHVNENYSDTPPDAQTSNLEIQDFMWTPPSRSRTTPQAPLKSSNPNSSLNQQQQHFPSATSPMVSLRLLKEMELKDINNAEASADAIFRKSRPRPPPPAPNPFDVRDQEPKERSPKLQRKIIFPTDLASLTETFSSLTEQ